MSTLLQDLNKLTGLLQDMARREKERLEGTPPQGHHRRLDRGHAEREPEQGGDTDSATASPIGGQGMGERPQRSDLAAYSEWFNSDEAVELLRPLRYVPGSNEWAIIAAVFVAGRLSQRREGEPGPQSEGQSVPNCRLCDQHHYEGVETECLKGSRCPFWAIRESDGASVPPIDQAEARPPLAPDTTTTP